MRDQLKHIEGQVCKFTGNFSRFGCYSHNGCSKKTVIFTRIYVVRNSEVIFIDHLWVRHSKRFERFGMLEENSIVTFEGTIKKYTKSKGVVDFGVVNVKNLNLEP